MIRRHGVWLHFVVALVGSIAIASAAPVVCQKGKRLTLRNDRCRSRETKVKLGADAVEMPILPVGPPACQSGQVLTSEGGVLACVDPLADLPTQLTCSVEIQVVTQSAAGPFVMQSPQCPTGAEVTGGGFRVQGVPPPGLIVHASKEDPVDATRWLCAGVVPPGTPVTVECLVHCCELERSEAP